MTLGFRLLQNSSSDALKASAAAVTQTQPLAALRSGHPRLAMLGGVALVALSCAGLGLAGLLSFGEATGLAALAAVCGVTVARLMSPGLPMPASGTSGPGLDHFGDLVTWHDSKGRVLAANVPVTCHLGLSSSDLHGLGLQNHVHVADRPMFLQALSDAAHGEATIQVTFRVQVRKPESVTPETRWLEMRARRLAQDPSRQGSTVVTAIQDVTVKRDQEEAREKTLRDAETLSSTKGGFLATVSHELRTPLNAIIGFSEILASDTLRPQETSQQLEYARIIHTSGHHLLEVVNALLDVSKIESGALTLELEATDLTSLINSCCDLMAMRATNAGIHFDRVTGPDLEQVVCDRRAIKQIVLNLLSNALKFTPKGGNVTIAAVRDGQMIDLSVTDSGIGINAEDLPQIGRPFFQAKSSYDRSYEGTGLGLSVVRGLVGLHGGTLEIESAPESGTRVCLRIPANGAKGSAEPVKIVTFVKSAPRGLARTEPFRLTA